KDLGMADAIRLVGAVEDPAPCLADADLYLFSSRTESFGLGVLEAMASALPVVGPRVGGVSEVLGNPPAGRLLRPSSPLALAEAAHEILTCPETYRQLADRARSRAREVFRPERVVELYLGAYARALVS
ncbi:MAG: glycosyltransferase, partial [Planctomycetota bacterium]